MPLMCEKKVATTTTTDIAIQTLEGDCYWIEYNHQTTIFNFRDSLELKFSRVDVIVQALTEQLLQQQPNVVTLNLRGLQNSTFAGIIMISKFIVNIRTQQVPSVTILGSHNILWHGESLKKIQRLLPSAELIME